MTIGPPHSYKSEGLRRGISEEILQNALRQAQIVQRRGLPPVLTLGHLAYLTGVQYQYLRQTVSRSRNPYKVFPIRKHRGGQRFICIPQPSLLTVQKWIAQNVLSKMEPHWRSFAYSPKSSIVRCAQEHCGARWLIKIDIQNFFESISERQVYLLFNSHGYQPLISFEMARICTRLRWLKEHSIYRAKWDSSPSRYTSIPQYTSSNQGHLPQGAPTSPMIANMVCMLMDEALNTLASREGLIYTRYADDIIFSTANHEFSRSKARRIITSAYRILSQNEFSPNLMKTHVVPPGGRKIVLGLLVDRDKPKLSSGVRNKIKRYIWAIDRFGLAQEARHLGFRSVWGFKHHIDGLIAFSKMVEPDLASNLEDNYKETLKKDGWISHNN